MLSGLANSGRNSGPGDGRREAFTLLELLAAATVFMLIMVLTLTVTSHLARLTGKVTSSLSVFQEARTAFETINRMLSQAVLNTYWDYDNPANPKHYLRASELHFVLGPATMTGLTNTAGSSLFCQAPLSMATSTALKSRSGLLNSFGFYVRFSQSDDLPPFLVENKPATSAWRLWLYFQPTESMKVYKLYSGSPQAASDLSWFKDKDEVSSPVRNHILANNIFLLLIRAGRMDANGVWQETYLYDSRGTATTNTFPQEPEIHQAPPVLNVTLMAIDQRSADRLLAQSEGAVFNLLPEKLFTKPADYRTDLAALYKHLDSAPLGGIPIHYRVFESTVNLTSSKWSR